jgi:hypothetical protein
MINLSFKTKEIEVTGDQLIVLMKNEQEHDLLTIKAVFECLGKALEPLAVAITASTNAKVEVAKLHLEEFKLQMPQ